MASWRVLQSTEWVVYQTFPATNSGSGPTLNQWKWQVAIAPQNGNLFGLFFASPNWYHRTESGRKVEQLIETQHHSSLVIKCDKLYTFTYPLYPIIIYTYIILLYIIIHYIPLYYILYIYYIHDTVVLHLLAPANSRNFVAMWGWSPESHEFPVTEITWWGHNSKLT